MAERFCTTLDCASVGSLPDGFLDELPRPATLGATRVGGIDLGSARARRVMAAIAPLSAAPKGFTVAELAAKVHRAGQLVQEAVGEGAHARAVERGAEALCHLL